MEQHMEALARANEIRFARAGIKERVAAGELSVTDAIAEPSCQSMRLFDLLAVQHRWGPARAHRVLNELHMSGTYPVARVTPRQARLLRSAIAKRDARSTAAPRRGAIAVA